MLKTLLNKEMKPTKNPKEKPADTPTKKTTPAKKNPLGLLTGVYDTLKAILAKEMAINDSVMNIVGPGRLI